MNERIGDWIQIYTGRRFWPLSPRVEDVDIVDIAHALSMLCRFNGHVSRFYSVAEHSLLVCEGVAARAPRDRDQQLAGLLHDAAEAYLADVPSPIKPFLIGYKEAEKFLGMVIAQAFGLPILFPTCLIKEMDTRILVDEARELMPIKGDDWTGRFGPALGCEIKALPPGAAERAFLTAFRNLTEGR